MASPYNITRIPAPRVPFLDERTGQISREWYRFLLNLFVLTGSGTNPTTLDELQLGPPPLTIDEINVIIANNAGDLAPQYQDMSGLYADLYSQAQLASMPSLQLGTMAPINLDNVPYLGFNTSPQIIPTAVGSLYWDGGTTFGVQMTANVLGAVNESGYYYVKASSAITKGEVVMFTGAVGSSGVPTGAPATGVTDGSYIMGIAAESISLNGFGLVQYQGTLKGLNTSAYVDGDILWYNPAVTGGLTKTKPSAPNVKVQMAAVINAGSGGSGSILIRVSPGSELGGTDSNVQFGTLATNDLIQYNGTYWTNVAPSSISIGTATNLAGGAANRIPYQTAPSTTSFIVAPTVANTYLEWSGTAFQWSANPLGSVTSVSVVTANGFAGTVATATTTPAITLTTTITGLLKGNGTAISAATSGTDYAPATSGTSILYGNGAGGFSNVTIGSGVSFAGGTLSATGSGGTVTSVAALTIGTTGTDLSSTVANSTTTPVITLNVPTASATNRGALSAADWTTFNSKANAFTYTSTYIPYGQGTTTPAQSADLTFNATSKVLTATGGIGGGNF